MQHDENIEWWISSLLLDNNIFLSICIHAFLTILIKLTYVNFIQNLWIKNLTEWKEIFSLTRNLYVRIYNAIIYKINYIIKIILLNKIIKLIARLQWRKIGRFATMSLINALFSAAGLNTTFHGEEDLKDTEKEVLTAKAVTMVVLCTVSTIMGIVPMFLARWLKWDMNDQNPR